MQYYSSFSGHLSLMRPGSSIISLDQQLLSQAWIECGNNPYNLARHLFPKFLVSGVSLMFHVFTKNISISLATCNFPWALCIVLLPLFDGVQNMLSMMRKCIMVKAGTKNENRGK